MRKILRAFRVPWPFRQRRHTWLPARDLLDGDLDRARRKPGCALCRLAQEHDQQLMHSFLWEYCTDPAVGAEARARWGFCPYHSWSLAIWEREHMGDSLGISMIYHPLLKQCQRLFRTALRHVPVGPEISSVLCRFCAAAQREETWFLQRLVTRGLRAAESDEQRSWDELHTELCVPHLQLFLQACGAAMPAPQRSWFQRPATVLLTAGLSPEHARLVSAFSESLAQRMRVLRQAGAVRSDDQQVLLEQTALLTGAHGCLPLSFPAELPLSRQMLLFTGPRSQFQSPESLACPVCAAASAACLQWCREICVRDAVVLLASVFCRSHRWLLAAWSSGEAQPEEQAAYASWMQQHCTEQLEAFASPIHHETARAKPVCSFCLMLQKASEQRIAALLRDMRAAPVGLAFPTNALLCLAHWRQAHARCQWEADAPRLQERLLYHQQHQLQRLDLAVEAYLASLNDSRRQRGDVPDLPEAAWAWERLIAFFAGEPALVVVPAQEKRS